MEILKSLVERRERKRGREGRQVWRESGGARGMGEDRDLPWIQFNLKAPKFEVAFGVWIKTKFLHAPQNPLSAD